MLGISIFIFGCVKSGWRVLFFFWVILRLWTKYSVYVKLFDWFDLFFFLKERKKVRFCICFSFAVWAFAHRELTILHQKLNDMYSTTHCLNLLVPESRTNTVENRKIRRNMLHQRQTELLTQSNYSNAAINKCKKSATIPWPRL